MAGGSNWLTSGTMIARQNFLTRLLDSQTLSASSWLHSLPLATNGAASTLAQTILQGDFAPASLAELEGYLNGTGSAALASLSAENYDQRVSGAVYLDDGDARVPTELTHEARMRRRTSYLQLTASGLAVIAKPEHVFARALAQAPLPGLPGSDDRCLVLDQSLRRQRWLKLRRTARQRRLLSTAPGLGHRAKRRARDRRPTWA